MLQTAYLSRRIAVVLSLCALLTLCACSRGAGGSDVGGAEAPQDLAQSATVPFPDKRESSALTLDQLAGSAAERYSLDGVEYGSELQLAPSDKGVGYATYRFKPVNAEPDTVSIYFGEIGTSEAWIGLPDHETKRWTFHGPFTERATLGVDQPRYISPAGNLWIAVLVTGFQQARIEQLRLISNEVPNIPPTAHLTLSENNVPVNFSFTLDARESYDPDGYLSDYEWDLNGNGVFNEPGPEQAARYQQTTQVTSGPYPEDFLVRVRVTDNRGASDTAVAEVMVNAWASQTVEGLSGSGPSLQEVAGQPAISYSSSNGLMYAFKPRDLSEWTSVNVHKGTLQHCLTSSLRTKNGKPAIAFAEVEAYITGYDFGRVPSRVNLKYAYSDTIDGASGWNIVTIDDSRLVGQMCKLALINGKPAIAYYDQGANLLKYAYSTEADGSSGWHIVNVDELNFCNGLSLAEISGAPAIAYGGQHRSLSYAYSRVPDGSVDWITYPFKDNGTVEAFPSLAAREDGAALTYCDLLYSSGQWETHLKYAHSTSPLDADSWAARTVVTAEPHYHISIRCPQLLVKDSQPWIAFYEISNNQGRYKVASTVESDPEAQWLVATIDKAPYFHGSYDLSLISLTEIAGKLSICHQNSLYPELSLRYATHP